MDFEEIVLRILAVLIIVIAIIRIIAFGVELYAYSLKLSLLKQYGPEVVEGVINWLG